MRPRSGKNRYPRSFATGGWAMVRPEPPLAGPAGAVGGRRGRVLASGGGFVTSVAHNVTLAPNPDAPGGRRARVLARGGGFVASVPQTVRLAPNPDAPSEWPGRVCRRRAVRRDAGDKSASASRWSVAEAPSEWAERGDAAGGDRDGWRGAEPFPNRVRLVVGQRTGRRGALLGRAQPRVSPSEPEPDVAPPASTGSTKGLTQSGRRSG